MSRQDLPIKFINFFEEVFLTSRMELTVQPRPSKNTEKDNGQDERYFKSDSLSPAMANRGTKKC